MGFHLDICYGNSHSMPQAVMGTQCQHDSCYKLANEGNTTWSMGLLVQPLIRTPFITQHLEAPIPTGGSDDVLTVW